MEEDKLPYISVIITAYNRKEFLLNAIKSALNQTTDKKYYEIIVIKNFTDENIDDFINKNNIKNILMDGTVGEFLAKGISEANGEIISFLDDDDLFFENKLEVVYNKFKKDNNIVYYHNSCIPINKNMKNVNIDFMPTTPDFNMSSISIKKSIVKINKANKINMSQDILMYLYALESNKKILIEEEKLTYYMVHDSATNIVSNNFEEYRKFVLTKSNLILDGFKICTNAVQSQKAVNYINWRITSVQMDRYIFGSTEIPSKLINYMINSTDSLKYRVELIFAYMLIRIYPKSRKYISNKIWTNHSKQANEI